MNLFDLSGKGTLVTHANPLRRLGEPDDVAGTAVLLAPRAGNFITGQTFVVDGGGLIGGGEPLM
jgi:NAD(P)-dependent dehydrogenase (short-subunit alcohol dehydrogenase family)